MALLVFMKISFKGIWLPTPYRIFRMIIIQILGICTKKNIDYKLLNSPLFTRLDFFTFSDLSITTFFYHNNFPECKFKTC